jgi:hypothetical protein
MELIRRPSYAKRSAGSSEMMGSEPERPRRVDAPSISLNAKKASAV